jgi:hypothetical protein
MKQVLLDLPALGFVVATRAALGVGIGLLLSSHIPEQRRRALGMTLIGIGVTTTLPAVQAILDGMRMAQRRADVPLRRS